MICFSMVPLCFLCLCPLVVLLRLRDLVEASYCFVALDALHGAPLAMHRFRKLHGAPVATRCFVSLFATPVTQRRSIWLHISRCHSMPLWRLTPTSQRSARSESLGTTPRRSVLCATLHGRAATHCHSMSLCRTRRHLGYSAHSSPPHASRHLFMPLGAASCLQRCCTHNVLLHALHVSS